MPIAVLSHSTGRASRILRLVVGAALAAAAAWIGLGALARRERGREADRAAGSPTVIRLRSAEAGWRIEVADPSAGGGPLQCEHFDTKAAATDRAREIAHREAPSVLLIYRADGSEQHRHAYDADPDHPGLSGRRR